MLYQGSKASIGAKIAKVIEFYQPGRVFVEPFCGGLNLTQYVKGIKYCSDANPYLIAMWEKILYEDWLGPKEWTKELHTSIKENKEKYPPELVGWVGFCTFGGKFFDSYSGINHRTKQNYHLDYYNNITAQRGKLHNVILKRCSYTELELTKPTIIYCDPPYVDTYGYFLPFNHFFFWDWCRQQTKEHVILVSEYTAPKDFRIVWSTTRTSRMRPGDSSQHRENLYIHESQFTRTFYEPRS
jgi:DNA adenine methylase